MSGAQPASDPDARTAPSPEAQSGLRPHIVVVGSGPAGLMAAEVAARSGARVTVLEQMPSAGRKLLMAGRGGLNLTHSEDLDRFLERYGPTRPVVEAAIRAFPPAALNAWAEALGQPTFVGSSGRVFPRAMKASPLLRAWLAQLAGLDVTLRTRHRLVDLAPGPRLTVAGPDGASTGLAPDAVVLALGADGRWAALLAGAGIDVQPLRPSNAGVAIAWSRNFADRFAGMPLKRIAATCGSAAQRGEAIVNRAGLEGGVVYALSPALRAALDRDGTATLTLDLRPDVTADALEARLSRTRKGDSRANALRKAAQLSPAAIALLREATSNTLPTDPAALATLIKVVPLQVTALMDLERAISTVGGVAAREIDPHFMLEKLPGVFVAGEMIDWDAPTGGYLLQACLATGSAAGRGAVNYAGGARTSRSHRT